MGERPDPARGHGREYVMRLAFTATNAEEASRRAVELACSAGVELETRYLGVTPVDPAGDAAAIPEALREQVAEIVSASTWVGHHAVRARGQRHVPPEGPTYPGPVFDRELGRLAELTAALGPLEACRRLWGDGQECPGKSLRATETASGPLPGVGQWLDRQKRSESHGGER